MAIFGDKDFFSFVFVFLILSWLLTRVVSTYTYETRDDQDDQNNKKYQEDRFIFNRRI